MSKTECTICKHYGERSDSPELERATIFDDVGTAVALLLCRKHAVELFKNGQKKFLISHHKILIDIVSSDETKFLDILERVVRENLDEIY